MAAFTLEPIDSIQVTTLMDNVSDMLMSDLGPAKRAVRSPKPPVVPARTMEEQAVFDALKAEHGFSALVAFSVNGREHRLLFDTGTTPDGMTENMRRLSIALKDIEVIVLSHGHVDHTAGMDGVIGELGRANLPVYVHPEFWSKRRIAIPGRDAIEIPTTSRSALEGAGFEIVEEQQPSFLFERSVLITGEVDRTTEFEKGFAVHQALRGGAWQPDPLILDDQALIAHVRDKGLVVLTGCGHAGIVNIVRYAKKLTGVDDVYAVIGGFHLSGALFDPIIPQTVDALAELRPQWIVPAHCTGWRAQHALSARLPEAFVPNSVGTRFEL